MNIGQLDGQPLALQIFNGMTAESTCVNERWAKDQLFRCVCFAGGRHQTILDETVGPIFQSTSSVWRTTRGSGRQRRRVFHFNPRPPCGGRRRVSFGRLFHAYFNPHPPCGGRLGQPDGRANAVAISIHVLRAEDDTISRSPGSMSTISIHVLRAEDDPGSGCNICSYPNFNPRPPCGGRR